MQTRVQVSQSGDSPAAGRARQRLKLGAMGYASVRHGLDADAGMVREGLAILVRYAIEYAEAVLGIDSAKRQVDPSADSPAISRARKRLGIAAIAYSSARHGIDAEPGIVREGLAVLAQSAIEYYEALMSASPKKRSADSILELGGGA